MEEPRYMKRKVKSGAVEASYTDMALIVNYEVEATVLGDGGEAMQVERKAHQKKIKLKTLDAHTNISLLAQEIVEKCKMIHPSKLSLVESLLYGLQQHRLKEDTRADSEKDVVKKLSKEKNDKKSDKKGEKREKKAVREVTKEDQKRPPNPASMDCLDSYMEKLYDDKMECKVQGSEEILELVQYAGNLETLIQNEALMGLLSRVLNEEYKKSYDLVLNIMRIFWSFANFVQMHSVLSNYRIGVITMKIVDFEIKRHKLRVDEEKAANQEQKTEDKESSRKREKEQDKMKKKAGEIAKKQDKLLFVCFSVLLNLGEDINTERKMVKKKIVNYLVEMLDRSSPDLLILTASFLKKLSIFEENKDVLRDLKVVEKLVKFIPCNNEQLMQGCLRLLFNLSFDPVIRDTLVKNSFIPKLVELLKRPQFRALTLRILYHMSIDDRCKSMFTYTEAIPIVMQLVINFPQNMIARELVALAINLSHNGRNAELMCQGEGLNCLVQRVLQTRDHMLMKVIRNVSSWSYSQLQELSDEQVAQHKLSFWQPFVVPLVKLALQSDNHDFLIEVLGTIANFTPTDMPSGASWAKIVTEHSLIPFLHKLLVPGFSQDDIVLEVIILVGNIALDSKCAPLLAGSRLTRIFHDLLQEKQDDPELVLQLLYTFYRLMRHADTRHEILYRSGILPDILEIAASSSNAEVRRLCDFLMDFILDQDINEDGMVGELGCQIKQKRFELHNAEFLEMIEHEDLHDDESFDQDAKHYAGHHDDDNENSHDDDHWIARHKQEHVEMDMELLDQKRDREEMRGDYWQADDDDA